MAFFRAMGADSVAYHKETVVGRADDHPGAALDYYGERGETPLRWGGRLAPVLGLSGGGGVTHEEFDAVFGPRGYRDPATGEQLTGVKRPGFEWVIGPHKSVAVLGVMGRAEDMHAILDAERDASLGFVEDWWVAHGGSRGRDQTRTPTGGLVYAVTRHGTTRAGDPHPHDHILFANITEMRDAKGGWKALDSAALRDMSEAATMVGRLHSAWKAVELGYAIETDQGRRWPGAAVADRGHPRAGVRDPGAPTRRHQEFSDRTSSGRNDGASWQEARRTRGSGHDAMADEGREGDDGPGGRRDEGR